MEKGRPQIITTENRVSVDIDDTLVETGRSLSLDDYKSFIRENKIVGLKSQLKPGVELVASYYDCHKVIKPKYATEAFVRSLKARGYHVTAHSHNGWQWALAVVVALEMEDCVDLIATKPTKCIDDATDFTHVCGTLIHPDLLK